MNQRYTQSITDHIGIEVVQQIDLERLELFVDRCKLQTLEYTNDGGTYALHHDHVAPAYWATNFTPMGEEWQPYIERRGLGAILGLIKTTYPDFYAYLVTRFPKESEESNVH